MFLTIQQSKLETFRFRAGDKVIIRYPGFPPEPATIHALHTSHQHGNEVVHGVMVITESFPCKPFAVSPAILEKTSND